jgi:type II secretory pathway component PulF
MVKGTAVAVSVEALQRDLAASGLSLVDVQKDLLSLFTFSFRAKTLKRPVLIDLFGYLHGLMAMGIDMGGMWRTVEESVDSPQAKVGIASIRQAIGQGFTLADAMERTGLFPALAISSVKAGEMAGSLEKVFQSLEAHYRSEQELYEQVMKATLYPLISVVILFFIAVGLLTFVIPQLREIFPPNPPLPTKVLVLLSDGAVGFWWTIPLFAVAAVVAWLRMPEKAKSRLWEGFYRVWLIGPLLKNLALCNVFFNFSMMLSSGVSLFQALETIIPMTTSKALQAKLVAVRDLISKGGTLSEGFRDPFFPNVVGSALRQGETTGRLDLYLSRLATFLRDRARARLQVMATFIEPALLLIGGGMVLFLAVGIFLPIYGQMKNMGR